VKGGFLKVLAGEPVWPPPLWMMRQAGRYLPEYREVRSRARNFLDFCYSPALATEVTLQPIRRFGFDAAILFSDILVVPDAMGRKVSFVEGEGPLLEPIGVDEVEKLANPEVVLQRLGPVYEAVERIRGALPVEIPLIGFCGAPWTVATYMIQGRGGDRTPSRLFAYRNPAEMVLLLDRLADASVVHLEAQAKAGANALQIFESWAEGLPPAAFQDWVVRPIRRIVDGLRQRGVTTPIIGFPRGAGLNLQNFAGLTGVDGVGIDTATSIKSARAILGDRADGRQIATQGAMDPQALVTGGATLERAVQNTLAEIHGVPHVFNLGHGITPDADPANVARFVDLVRSGT
jgi:uroporphyrinogen decarboxylase